MDFVPALAMIALIWKVVDFFKGITNKDWNAVITQLVVWGAGVAVVVLYAQTVWSAGIAIGDQTLATLNFASLVAVGLAAGAAASTAFDLKKALDGSDSAAQPKLMPYTPQHAKD